MTRRIAMPFMMVLCAGIALAQIPASTPIGDKAAASKPPTAARASAKPKSSVVRKAATPVAEALKQIENDWVVAQKGRDAAKLSAILGDDWVGLGWSGKTANKAQALANLNATGESLDSIEMGPMNVRVFGTVAIVTGSDTEKSKSEGKDSSGKYTWTDVFVQRNGVWKAVASQSTKVPE